MAAIEAGARPGDASDDGRQQRADLVARALVAQATSQRLCLDSRELRATAQALNHASNGSAPSLEPL
jgi:hypothetical protein